MKIDRISTLKITGNRAIKSALEAIPKGGKVEARVVERLDGGKAVIDIAGKRVTAEFLKGIPASKRFELVLEMKRGNQFHFRLAGGERAGELFKALDTFFLGGTERLKARLPELKSYREVGGLYALNRALAGLRGSAMPEPLAAFLNILMNFGIKKEKLILFSYFLGRRRGIHSERLFQGISLLLGGEGFTREIEGLFMGGGQAVEEWVDGFLGELRGRSMDEDARRYLQEALEMQYGDIKDKVSGIEEYEAPFFDDGVFKSMKVMSEGESLICTATLSALGRIEVFGRERGGHISVSILCEEDKSVEILKRDLHNLQEALKGPTGSVPVVNVQCLADIEKKTADLILALIEDAAFDYRA